MAIFKLAQDSSSKKIVWTSFFGVYSYLLLDSFLHRDTKPFYPLDNNPFLGLFSFAEYPPLFHRRGFSERRTHRSYPTLFPSFALRATEWVINRVFRSFSVGYHSYPTQFHSYGVATDCYGVATDSLSEGWRDIVDNVKTIIQRQAKYIYIPDLSPRA